MNKETTPKASSLPLQELIKNKTQLRALLEASHISGPEATTDELWQMWVNQRKFIADTIPRSGSVLDYGCANGFFLKCLEAWSPHELESWGMDIDEEALAKAKTLYPDAKDNFMTPQAFTESEVSSKKFDYVYWNVWDNYDFDDKGMRLLRKLMDMTASGGTTALGFYDTKENNLAKIEALKAMVGQACEVVENKTGDEMLLLFKKK